jgi:hypothetical protein
MDSEIAKLGKGVGNCRIADIQQTRLGELLPWNWREAAPTQKAS